jgi:CDP-glucose 4,6-dehydratase
MRALLMQEPIVIRYPGAVRPWQHVLEPLLGYLLLAERLYRDGAAFGGGWNFGPNDDDARPVGTLVEQLVARWGHGARASIDEGPHPHEARHLKLDCSKAKARLGWAPRWSLPIALDKTVEWYKAYSRHEDILDLTLSQIDSYAVHVP